MGTLLWTQTIFIVGLLYKPKYYQILQHVWGLRQSWSVFVHMWETILFGFL